MKKIRSSDVSFPKAGDSELNIDEYMSLADVDAAINSGMKKYPSLAKKKLEFKNILSDLAHRTNKNSETFQYIQLLLQDLDDI
jgi:hypothetical protein